MRRQRRPTPPTRLSALLLGLSIGLIAAACSAVPSNTPSGSPNGSPSSAPSNAPTDVPGTSTEPSASTGPGEPTQTDTAWGRIWDALPGSFPTPPGSSPSQPIGRGPSSGEFDVDASVEDVMDFYASALTGAGYLASKQGPLEDGSVVFDASVAGSDCHVQVTITPLGGVTHVTILYGAACPFR